MSLLIKALASAEKGKQAELGKGVTGSDVSAGLMLEPLPKSEPALTEQKQDASAQAETSANKEQAFNAAATASLAKVRQQPDHKKDSSQQLAANVFVANQSAKQPASLPFLIMLGVAGALLIWIGLQVYEYFSRPAAIRNTVSQPAYPSAAILNEAQPSDVSKPQTAMVPAPAAEPSPPITEGIVSVPKLEQADANLRVPDASLFAGSADGVISKPESVQVSAMKRTTGQRVAVDGEISKEASKASVDVPRSGAPLKLVARTPAAGVDPVLLSAYEAYSRGDDATAQQQYRQVLQADTRNVDALLGMAAIAIRQSRYADANGWYQKVLEIEPRNSVALSAIANLEISSESAGAGSAAVDYSASESRIKNMLAQQPDAANLHAALGNLYASRNQWSLAQAAYFDASRHAPNSADYAFNLAVSLDQLGKSALALAQYQRALDLLNSSGTGKLDKAQLEARIKALQD